MKTEKQKPIAIKKTSLGKIRPHIGHDTLKGKPISNGAISMGYHLGTLSAFVGGKNVQVDLIGGGGLTLSVVGGRDFILNVKAIFEHAVQNGLLEDVIDFKEAE